jgi:hypothetical protein
MNPPVLGRLLASLRLCISYWLLFRRAGRPSTATLGLGRDSREQRIDFHIIQPLQCSNQVLPQEMALLRGQAVRPGFALAAAEARPPSSGVVSAGRRVTPLARPTIAPKKPSIPPAHAFFRPKKPPSTNQNIHVSRSPN